MPRRGVGKRLDPDVREAIELLAALGWNAPKIDRVLGGTSFADRMPDLRTLQRYVQRVRQRSGPDEPWQRTEMAGDDARLVLETLGAIIRDTGEGWTFTRAQAKWVLWVRQVVPDLDPMNAWLAALHYLARERSSAPDYVNLDAFLAFAPWRSEKARSAYDDAVKAGGISFVDRYRFLSDAIGDWKPG